MSSNPKDAEHLGSLYLRGCLKRSTFTRVAVNEGKVVGVILASSEKSAPRFAIIRSLSQLYAAMLLFSTKTGRKIGKVFGGFEKVDSELLENSKQSFDGEICLFAVSEECRGAGVGKCLYSAAIDYLKSENAKSYYLFTDTMCTYQFYEKRGMKRIGEKKVKLRPYLNCDLNMFLYSNRIE